MSLIIFLTVIQAIVAFSLIAVILMQRSEGGGLGVGGSPAGLMSARGAADFLTRTTTILATMFVILSILLAALAAGAGSGRTIDTSLQRTAQPGPTSAPATFDPLSGAAQPQPALPASPAPSGSAPADPLSGATKQ